MSGTRSEMGRLVKQLERDGFSVTRTGSGHWMVRPPTGEGSVVLAFSPRSSGLHLSLKQLRKIGFKG